MGKIKQHNPNIAASVLLSPRPLWKTGTTYKEMGDCLNLLRYPVQAAVRRLWHNDDLLLASAAAAARPGGAAELADDNESLVTVMI